MTDKKKAWFRMHTWFLPRLYPVSWQGFVWCLTMAITIYLITGVSKPVDNAYEILLLLLLVIHLVLFVTKVEFVRATFEKRAPTCKEVKTPK